jgi:hypothetical protein
VTGAASSIASLPAELRLSVLEVSVEPLPVVTGVVEFPAQRTLEFQPRLERRFERRVERPFRVPEPQRRVLREPVGEGLRPLVDGVVAADLVDQPAVQRLLGVDELPGEDELLGLREPDEPGQPLCRPAVGERPQPHLDDAVGRLPSEHAEITGKRQLEGARRRGPPDACDDRPACRLDGREQVREDVPLDVGVGLDPVPHHLQVHPRTEDGPLAEERHHPHVVGVADRPEGRRQVPHQLDGHRVAILGPREVDVGPRFVPFDGRQPATD